MKTLGIIGGTSWHSTIEYYRLINSAVNRIFANETNPPLLLLNLNQREIHTLQEAGRWEEIAEIYAEAALRLQAAGCDGVLFAANTAHKVFDSVSPRLRIPILHIADAAAAAIRLAGVDTVGLIGTLITMEQDFLRARLLSAYGIKTLTPDSSASRLRLHQVIHRELGMGVFRAETKDFILDEIRELANRGAQGIILGCTEFPLIVGPSDLDLPSFDTLRLHASMAVEFITGSEAHDFGGL
jgi:aspartate racemase